MIDIHTHCRDWEWRHKETIEHALRVAYDSGLSGIFDMPNTVPVITTRELVKKRLDDARRINSPIFYGLYVGLTPEPRQIEEAVDCHREFFPYKGNEKVGVIGLKMFAGKSVGDLSVTDPNDRLKVYGVLAELKYDGVLVVHCEDELKMNPKLWDSNNPISHCYARPEEAEVCSIGEQIGFAVDREFLGHLHIAHVSTPESADLVTHSQYNRISCGVTPNHLLLSNRVMKNPDGILYKVNPPLRDPLSKERLLQQFKESEIDILESDHAPHTYEEKTKGFMSGIPGLSSWPFYLQFLMNEGVSEELINESMYDNVNRIFGTNIPRLGHKSDLEKCIANLQDYAFDPCKYLPARV